MKVLLLNGSPAVSSHTGTTIQLLNNLFSSKGQSCETIDLLSYGLPINDPKYHADAMQSTNQKVKDFATAVKQADIVVLGTPLYHGSFSGLLKMAMDNLDGDALENKRVLILSNASGARGSMQAAQELVVVPRTMGGDVYNRLIGTCKDDFEYIDGELVIANEAIITRCTQIVDDICRI